MSEELDPAVVLRAGVQLFNDGQYLAAHEVFEELWEAGYGPDADFYKGLIQASIALLHLQRGNVEGARKLYTGHRQYLAKYLPAHLGIDVTGFLGSMQTQVKPKLRHNDAAPLEADERPRIASL